MLIIVRIDCVIKTYDRETATVGGKHLEQKTETQYVHTVP